MDPHFDRGVSACPGHSLAAFSRCQAKISTSSDTAQIVELSRELVVAKHQIDWFKRQLFGQKSE